MLGTLPVDERLRRVESCEAAHGGGGGAAAVRRRCGGGAAAVRRRCGGDGRAAETEERRRRKADVSTGGLAG